jgi:hypothetical protein
VLLISAYVEGQKKSAIHLVNVKFDCAADVAGLLICRCQWLMLHTALCASVLIVWRHLRVRCVAFAFALILVVIRLQVARHMQACWQLQLHIPWQSSHDLHDLQAACLLRCFELHYALYMPVCCAHLATLVTNDSKR